MVDKFCQDVNKKYHQKPQKNQKKAQSNKKVSTGKTQNDEEDEGELEFIDPVAV